MPVFLMFVMPTGPFDIWIDLDASKSACLSGTSILEYEVFMANIIDGCVWINNFKYPAVIGLLIHHRTFGCTKTSSSTKQPSPLQAQH